MENTDSRRSDSRPLSPYEAWQQQEGVPIYRAQYIDSLYTLELSPWERKGGSGAYLNLAEQYEEDALVMEIPPGGQLNPEHHLYEGVTFVLSGRGATSVWGAGIEKRTVEWKPGSLFATPLNMQYQHFNASGTEPARLVAVTRQPKIFELYRSADFIYRCDWAFTERFAGEKDYFTDPGQRLRRLFWKTNFVPDVRSFALDEYPERGAGFNMKFDMAGNAMVAHISEFPTATYKKGHRHGPGAHLIIIGGQGYSLLWFEGDEERRRVNWSDGSIVAPCDGMFHQHFNTGPAPARYLAIRKANPMLLPRGGRRDTDEVEHWRFGMSQIEYQDEDPRVRKEYEAELAKVGLNLQLDEEEFHIEDTLARVARGELG